MRKIIYLLMFFGVSYTSLGQCSIQTSTDDDGVTYYIANREELYKSDYLEESLLMVFGQLVVLQHSQNKEKLKFILSIYVASNGDRIVIPRKIVISFKDYSSLSLIADTQNKPEFKSETEIESCVFILSLDEYGQLHKKAIAYIKIEDTRTNESFSINPYEYLFLEQANCIAKSIKR